MPPRNPSAGNPPPTPTGAPYATRHNVRPARPGERDGIQTAPDPTRHPPRIQPQPIAQPPHPDAQHTHAHVHGQPQPGARPPNHPPDPAQPSDHSTNQPTAHPSDHSTNQPTNHPTTQPFDPIIFQEGAGGGGAGGVPPLEVDSPQERALRALRDPQVFVRLVWPHVRLYDKQWEVMYSVHDDDETYVYAGNMLGKDFVTAITILWFFCTRHPCRVVTTSADYSQLEAVLWGEMGRFIDDSADTHPLDSRRGGPILVNHMRLRKVYGASDRRGRRTICKISYIIARTAARGEGMLGHHCRLPDGVPRSLFVADEASAVDDNTYGLCQSWAERMLIIGNPYAGNPGCTFFERNCKAGNLPVTAGSRHPHSIAEPGAVDPYTPPPSFKGSRR